VSGVYVAVIDVVAELPALSVAMAVIVFAPAIIGTVQVNVPLPRMPFTPLQVTDSMPDVASLTDPDTGKVADVLELWSAGEVIATTGAVLSTVIVTSAVFEFPESSVATAVINCGPSLPLNVMVVVQALLLNGTTAPLTVTLATETSSLAVPLTVMAVCFVNVPAAGEVMVIVGFCVSGAYVALMTADDVLPALSAAATLMSLLPTVRVTEQV
jgi:hypothetical protein